MNSNCKQLKSICKKLNVIGQNWLIIQFIKKNWFNLKKFNLIWKNLILKPIISNEISLIKISDASQKQFIEENLEQQTNTKTYISEITNKMKIISL